MRTMVCGSLPEIIRNDRNLYEGNLIGYFQAIFSHAQNLQLQGCIRKSLAVRPDYP